MNKALRKVTFSQEPEYLGSATRPVNNNQTHAGILQYYHPVIAKHLSLTSPLYRKLKENGILTTEQIGLLELEETPYGKVSKLIAILTKADHHVFTTFCAIIHETGHRQLAQTLQEATRYNRQVLPEVPTIQRQQIPNETHALHMEYNKTMKEENVPLKKQYQGMRRKYMTKLQDLEESISLAKWKRELVIKETDIIWSENEALKNLNKELEALVEKLQETSLRFDMHDLGYSTDVSKKKTKLFPPSTNLGLIYR